jgi:hypothetical protein
LKRKLLIYWCIGDILEIPVFIIKKMLMYTIYYVISNGIT